MPNVARVTCPQCGMQFQVPVEQILDPRVDPTVTERLLTGAVNIARCPKCGYLAPLNLPLLYHDADKEVALLYLPLSAGKTEAERQQVAGRLTRQLMDRLPPEERKGYLFNPETFVSMESLIRRVYELTGIGAEVLEQRQAQSRLIESLLEGEETQWPSLLDEHADLLDKDFFTLLLHLRGRAVAAKEAGAEIDSAEIEKLDRIIALLKERNADFRRLVEAEQAIHAFMQSPSYETLVDAFLAQPDDEAVEALAAAIFDKLDYHFFNEFVRRIDEAPSEEEAERLREVRRRVLAARDRITALQQEVVQKRLALIDKLLATQEPRKMLLSHLGEIDDLFFEVLLESMVIAEREGNAPLAERLRELLEMVMALVEERLPPVLVLARKLLAAKDEATVDKLLQEQAALVSPELAETLEAIAQSAVRVGQQAEADRALALAAKVTARVAAQGGQVERTPPSASGADDASRGFIISTKK